MRESSDTSVSPLPYWMADALRREVTSTANTRAQVMDRVRREPPRVLSAPIRASRWARRGALTPMALLGTLGALFITLSLRDVGRRADVTMMTSALIIGDSVVPSRDTVGGALRDSFLDTLHIVEFVLRGGVSRSAVVVGDFNGWQRGVTPLQPNANGEWRTRALVPRDALRYAYVVDEKRIVSAPPLTVVRHATRWRPDSI